MEPTSSKISISTFPKRPSQRLLFDRRYGWVFDEWKDPSEEALAGGRGMFCILPLAKALFKTASQSIKCASNFAVEVIQRPDLLSLQALQASLDKQLNKFTSFIEIPEFNYFALKGSSLSQSLTLPSRLQFGTREP